MVYSSFMITLVLNSAIIGESRWTRSLALSLFEFPFEKTLSKYWVRRAALSERASAPSSFIAPGLLSPLVGGRDTACGAIGVVNVNVSAKDKGVTSGRMVLSRLVCAEK